MEKWPTPHWYTSDTWSAVCGNLEKDIYTRHADADQGIIIIIIFI